MRKQENGLWSLLGVFVILLILQPGGGWAAPLGTITVEAGDFVRTDSPASVALDGATPDTLGKGLKLTEIKGNDRVAVPCQVEAGSPARLWWILDGTTPAGEKRVYELETGSDAAKQAVGVRQDEKVLDIRVGQSDVLRFNHAPVPPPEGSNPLFTSSGFTHPLWTLAGARLTRIHPKDHIHHLGLWNPWTDTMFEGQKVDFWNIGDGTGTVRFRKFTGTESGPVFGGFSAQLDHVALKTKEGEKTALNEDRQIRVWAPGKTRKGVYLLDYVIRERCATASPLQLPHYRYGGLGFRATEEWDKPGSDYLTSEGKTRKDGHATRARWCLVYGPTEKGPAGILFMSNPVNRCHPEPVRIWNDSNQVFFNFCPVQQEDWAFEPGQTYELRYRLAVYDGSLDAAQAEAIWRDYANPPKVTLERK
jgi:hypothetical protein